MRRGGKTKRKTQKLRCDADEREHVDLLGLLGSGEVDGREGEVRGLGGVDTSGSDVESAEGSDETHSSSSLVDGGRDHELGDGEEQEGDGEEEEDEEESDGRLEGSKHHQEGEDEPSHEVDTKSGLELSLRVLSGKDTRAGPVDQSERKPKGSVRGESGGSEGVTTSELPHSSEELSESSETHGHSDDDVGVGDSSDSTVVPRKDEGGRRESEETERSRVRELPVVDGERGLRGIERVSSRSDGSVDRVSVSSSVSVRGRVVVGLLVVVKGSSSVSVFEIGHVCFRR